MMITYKTKQIIKKWLDIILAVDSIIAMVSFIILVGFYLTKQELHLLQTIINITLGVFIGQEIIRWITVSNIKSHIKTRLLENVFSILLIFHFSFTEEAASFIQKIFPMLSISNITILYLAIIQLSLFNVLLIEALRYSHLFSKINLHPGAIFSLSFASIIIIGTAFLLLPRASAAAPLSFIDALFTSTSAVCVTGLIVVDTASAFSPLGKIIILGLIQIGGLGVMTLTTFFAALFAGGISFRVRLMMKDLLSQENIGAVKHLLKKILFYTLLIELIGAVILYISLDGSFTHIEHEKLYSAVFHSVSAFCNAGFSLYPDSLMNSDVSRNYYYISTIMLLIILGGLGFAVISHLSGFFTKIHRPKRYFRKLNLSSKIVLVSSFILIIAGMLGIYLFEPFNFSESSSWAEKLFHSLFQSVTARTAGFNTIPIELTGPAFVMITIVLMWIGASPGSTGGGIKTTTFVVAFLALIKQILGRERIELYGREIHRELIERAFLVVFSSIIVLFLGSFALILFEPDKAPLDLIFEAASALNTVGLSRNITFYIGTNSKIVIILLMFIGRIGVLTFFLSFYRPDKPAHYRLPKEGVVIG